MPATTVGGRYCAASEEHEVAVARDPAGRWQVFDHAPPHFTLVETLTGHDDRLDQALALAHDYAEQKQAYHDGQRPHDPLPKPAHAINDNTRDAA